MKKIKIAAGILNSCAQEASMPTALLTSTDG